MAVIGLFGGSFNPPHDGHVKLLRTARNTIGLDKVWMMATPASPLKDPASYAPILHRREMCKIITRDISEWLEPVDFEEDLGTNRTADILEHIAKEYPQHQFVWIMGSDNLAQFHKWGRWQYIMDNFPIAVLTRPDQDEAALNSEAAAYGKALRLDEPTDLARASRGWSFIDNHQSVNISASSILEQLRAGKEDIHGLRPEIRDYIMRNGLYGLDNNAPASTTKKPTVHHLKP